VTLAPWLLPKCIKPFCVVDGGAYIEENSGSDLEMLTPKCFSTFPHRVASSQISRSETAAEELLNLLYERVEIGPVLPIYNQE
jgi:hypothetical protein